MSSVGKEWYIACPWGRIAIIAWGDIRSQPVLLCHGKLDSALSFAPLIRLLPQDFYYVALDLPGCGKSDWMPAGMPMSTHDLTYAIKTVVDHFRWRKVIYVGHSLGALLGYQFHAVFPERVDRLVLLDPLPAYDTYQPEELAFWYKKFIDMYFKEENYHKYNAKRETAPLYVREKMVEILMTSRELKNEVAAELVDRIVEPVGNLYRFTFDQRMKKVTRPAQSAETLEKLCTSISIPVMCVLARDSIRMGAYRRVPFIFDPAKYPRGNYRVSKVDGGHDVHLNCPERVAPHVANFISPVASKL